jgi:hypothetical protein
LHFQNAASDRRSDLDPVLETEPADVPGPDLATDSRGLTEGGLDPEKDETTETRIGNRGDPPSRGLGVVEVEGVARTSSQWKRPTGSGPLSVSPPSNRHFCFEKSIQIPGNRMCLIQFQFCVKITLELQK